LKYQNVICDGGWVFAARHVQCSRRRDAAMKDGCFEWWSAFEAVIVNVCAAGRICCVYCVYSDENCTSNWRAKCRV